MHQLACSSFGYDDPHDATGRFDFVLANDNKSPTILANGDIRKALIKAEKMNSNP